MSNDQNDNKNDFKTEKEKSLTTDAVFIQIGLSPNTQFLKSVELNSQKEIWTISISNNKLLIL